MSSFASPPSTCCEWRHGPCAQRPYPHPGDKAAAYANVSEASGHKSGFGVVNVVTNPAYSNIIQMQAAGFVEGYLTAREPP